VLGWVTMENRSGTTFGGARIKLLAGDVNKVVQQKSDMMYLGRAMAESAPAVQEKSFDDFHLYTLRERTTLRDQEAQNARWHRR
jgi:hypothetical protein